ncbi:MAG TPA: nitronate monooxygenase [Stellaceae bacterium]|nr:nitronate monooxygenase [Stellaceae bacterium]
MALATRLTKRLGIPHPLLLAPMGSVSGGALAAAVTSAGGLGLIGGAYGEARSSSASSPRPSAGSAPATS